MSTLSFFLKIETFVYKHLVVLLQGDHTFDFVDDIYSKGQKVIDFGSGVGSNSSLFHPDDYTGVEVDTSRVAESKRAFPKHQFQAIPYISSDDQRLPFDDQSFDVVFISLCLHHINSDTCKILFQEFRRLLKKDGIIIGLEPCMMPSAVFSNIFMNLMDAGDYIITRSNYTAMYASESFKVNPINVIKVFGYHLWQYTASADGEISRSFSSGMTTFRKIIKPFHKIILYGKWVMVAILGLYLLQQIWSIIFMA